MHGKRSTRSHSCGATHLEKIVQAVTGGRPFGGREGAGSSANLLTVEQSNGKPRPDTLSLPKKSKIWKSLTAPSSPAVLKKSMTACIGMGNMTSAEAAAMVLKSVDVGSLATNGRFTRSATTMATGENHDFSHYSSSEGGHRRGVHKKRSLPGNLIAPIITLNNTSNVISRSKSDVKFQKLFDVGEDERLVKSFACALVDEILFQGTLYASENYFCFYAKIANKRKVIQLEIEDVKEITREKTAGIIPNAIAIHTKTERVLLTSFISRDSTFRCLTELWGARRPDNAFISDWNSPDTLDSSDDSEMTSHTNDITGHESSLGGRKRRSPLRDDASGAAGPLPPVRKVVSCIEGVGHKASVLLLSSSAHVPLSKDVASVSSGVKERLTEPLAESPTIETVGATATFDSTAGSLLDSRVNTVSEDDCKLFGNDYFKVPQCLLRLSRNEIYLWCAFFVLIVLCMCATLLAWRVHNFQVLLFERLQHLEEGNPLWMRPPTIPQSEGMSGSFQELKCSEDYSCQLYNLRNTLHMSEVNRIHATLATNINVLDGLLNSLRNSVHLANQDQVKPLKSTKNEKG